MTLTDLSIAVHFCDEKISKLTRAVQIGTNPEDDKDVKYWTEKRDGIKELMEQTVRAINAPKTKENGES